MPMQDEIVPAVAATLSAAASLAVAIWPDFSGPIIAFAGALGYLAAKIVPGWHTDWFKVPTAPKRKKR